jgi:hypothetical protein
MNRVGVVGAAGKMGRLVCAAVRDDPELELAAGVNPGRAGEVIAGVALSEKIDALADTADVAVVFTRPDAVMESIRWTVEHAIHAVVGTTGVGPEQLDQIRQWLEDAPTRRRTPPAERPRPRPGGSPELGRRRGPAPPVGSPSGVERSRGSGSTASGFPAWWLIRWSSSEPRARP